MAKNKDLGKLLKEHREGKGLSIRDVVKESKGSLTLSYISRLENGKAEVRPSSLHSLSEIYGTSYEEYLTLAGIINKDGANNISLLAGVNMSQEEQRELLRYLRFIRDKDNE